MSRAIVFDLDGTLVDSAPDIHAAANRLLGERGAPPLDLATVTGFIGNGIPHLVQLVMQARGIPKGEHAALTARMLALYGAAPADLGTPYPGVPEALTALRGAGFRLGVCTNKAHAPTIQVLDMLGLTGFFDAVIGGDSLPQRKPDPAPLLTVFGALGTPVFYVGDSEVDAETARRADVPFALFTRGYRKTPVDKLPYRLAFDSFADLPGLIADEVA